MSIIAKKINYAPEMLQPYPWSAYDVLYDLVLIIPACNESDIISTIDSLESCDYEERYAVILLINESQQCSSECSSVNNRCYDQIRSYKQKTSNQDIYVYYVSDIAPKKAGVGLARRLAMDQAVMICESSHTPIVNLDADCQVNKAYLSEIAQYANDNSKVELINIHYEHPYDHEPIIQYELHLRYFIEVQRYLKLPYAYHTVGSSFAVRAGAYTQVGRMNLRKAGEDFYFIHKFTKKGTMGICPDAIVIPSSRSSDRVPFGTGRAMIEMEGLQHYNTYNIQSFLVLRPLLETVSSLYGAKQEVLAQTLREALPLGAQGYFNSVSFVENITKLSNNAKTFETFEKAFYQWFDAFKLMKYLHHMRDHGYDDQRVMQQARDMLLLLDNDADFIEMSSSELLTEYRSIQKR